MKQKLFTTQGFLLTNASRLRAGTKRSKSPIEPKNEPHVNGCGCLTCRVTNTVDEAILGNLGTIDEAVDRELGKLNTSKALPPTPGIFNSQPKRGDDKPVSNKSPLLLPRGVLAGEAS
jgi:hypothetical protein